MKALLVEALKILALMLKKAKSLALSVNRAGKSTLIRCINMLEAPTSALLS